jgi:hypothetical protein
MPFGGPYMYFYVWMKNAKRHSWSHDHDWCYFVLEQTQGTVDNIMHLFWLIVLWTSFFFARIVLWTSTMWVAVSGKSTLIFKGISAFVVPSCRNTWTGSEQRNFIARRRIQEKRQGRKRRNRKRKAPQYTCLKSLKRNVCHIITYKAMNQKAAMIGSTAKVRDVSAALGWGQAPPVPFAVAAPGAHWTEGPGGAGVSCTNGSKNSVRTAK